MTNVSPRQSACHLKLISRLGRSASLNESRPACAAAGLRGKGKYIKVGFASADTSLRYETVRFLVPEIDGVNVRDRSLGLPLAALVAADLGVSIDHTRIPGLESKAVPPPI